MTTTVTIPNLPSAVADVSVAIYDETKILRLGDETSKDGKTYTFQYAYVGTDSTAVPLIEVKRTRNVDTTRIEIRLTAKERVDNGIDTPVDYPVEFFIGWVVRSANASHDLSAFMKAIGTLYSCTFGSVTSKVPNTAILSALLYGAVEVLDL